MTDTETPEPTPPRAARILVVDDEQVICDILADFLQFEGFTVETRGTAEAALQLLNRETFDLLLTDLKMPGMGGLDLLHRVEDLTNDTVTIMMTGYGTVETAIEAMKKGAFDYILKPFKPETVVQVLRRALEQQRLERENFELRTSVGFYELSEALSGTMPLDDQLDLIADMVQENVGGGGVEIITENPKKPGEYVHHVHRGPKAIEPKLEHILDTFHDNQRIVTTGNAVNDFVQNPRSAAYAVNAFMSAPLRAKGAPFGMINVYGLDNHAFTEGQRKGLSIFASRAANAIDTSRLYGNLANTFTQTIEGFARALEAKDPYTHGHSDRVAMYSRMIAETMGFEEKTCRRIEHGGLMHDIGKIGIRSMELNKPQRLTRDEYMVFQSHPVLGKRIIEPISFLNHLIPCVYYHHETFDGRGYPERLGGADIPLDARILSVADSYDAMTSDRPYRKALPHEISINELKRCARRQFDPEVIEAFMATIEDFRAHRIALGLPLPD